MGCTSGDYERDQSPLHLLFLVRRGGYIVNSLDSYRLIEKLSFPSSGVQLPEPNRGLLHFRHTVFSDTLKSKVGSTLTKTVSLRVNLNVDGVTITSKTHTHPSHSQTSRLFNLVFIFRCSSSPNNPVYVRRVDFSSLVFSLSSHRHS